MNKAPAFLFYAGDFLSSPDVQSMDTREVGAYVLLLLNAWQGDLPGHLPNNEDRLRRITRLSVAEWEVSRELLLAKFPVADMGHTRYNPRLVAEAQKQETNRLKKAENGKRGGRPKKLNESENNLPLSEGKQMLSESKANDKLTESLSISISSTTDVVEAPAREALPATTENRKAGARRLAADSGADTFPAEKSPLYKPDSLNAYYTELVQQLPGLDWGWYVTEMRLKAPEDKLTAPQWRNWIINFVKNEGSTYRRIAAPLPNQVASNASFVAPPSMGIPNKEDYLKPQPVGQYTGKIQ